MSDEDESQPEEESLRLKTMAEQKYISGDLRSALNYANRAHGIHPSLDALPEMITAFEILRAAEAPPALESSSENPNSAPDYYKILQTERFAHINTIKKQYKTLALALHPDKNPFPASAEAFKLVSEASRVLSDKNRRKEYDMRLRIAMQADATAEVGFAVAAEKFWTACSACRLLHQLEAKYIGHSLVCSSCKVSFKAMEVTEDLNTRGAGEKSSVRVSARIKDRNAKGPCLGIVERCGLGKKRKISSIGDVLQRSERVENSVQDKEEEEDDSMTLSQMKVLVKEKKQVEEKDKGVGNKGENKKEEVKELELKTYKRRVRKDHSNSNAEIIHVASNSPLHSEKDNSTPLQVEADGKRAKRRVYKSGDNFKVRKKGKSKDSELERLISKKKGSLEIMPVEDSEFHDFDSDRKGRSFRKGQVWALYDDADGMPRHYGLIDEIVSVNPFEVSLYWLLFQTSGDEELINQRKMGFCISCGSFKVSSRISIKYLNLFSHVVGCERASRSTYRIYPAKGSVWGLCRDDNTNNNKTCYDIVICLSGYSDAYGLSIGYLEKVGGFRTVYKRKEIGANAVICIGKSDVGLLSHQIPAKRLLGKEDLGLPGDCWELDPASLAPQMLIGE